MTPDMKRLCKAAKGALELEGVAAPEYLAPRTYITEAIVRAVLMELRKVGDETVYKIAEAAELGRYGLDHGDGYGVTTDVIEAYVDHILDTKNRRAEALSELARLDGKTL